MTTNANESTNFTKAEALRSVRRDLLDVKAFLAEQVGRKGPLSQTSLGEAIRQLDFAVSEINCHLETGS